MEKINFNLKADENYLKRKAKLIEELKNNVDIQNWLKKNNASEDLLNKYSTDFKMYLNNLEICRNCKGLRDCKMNTTGQVTTIAFENNTFKKCDVNCRYKQAYLAKTIHKKNMVVCDMSDEQLNYHPSMIQDRSEDMGEEGFAVYKQVFVDFKDKDIYKDYKGLVFYGIPGVGKTFAACCLINRVAKQGINCAFVNVPMLVNRLKETFNDYNKDYNYELNKLKRVDFLVLDDLGGEKISEWERDEILLPLLTSRMEHKKITYFTTNYDYEGLLNIYKCRKDDAIGSIRLLERIQALANFMPVLGTSRRIN